MSSSSYPPQGSNPPNENKNIGWASFIAENAGADGFFTGGFLAVTQAGTFGKIIDSTGAHGRWSTGATTNNQAGSRSAIFIERSLDPSMSIKFKLGSVADVRLWIGFYSTTALPTGADGVGNQSGCMLHLESGGTNWKELSNNGGANSTIADFGGGIPADTNQHKLSIRAINSQTKFQIKLDNDAWNDVTTTIPAETTDMDIIYSIQTTADVVKAIDFWELNFIQN